MYEQHRRDRDERANHRNFSRSCQGYQQRMTFLLLARVRIHKDERAPMTNGFDKAISVDTRSARY